MKRQTIQLLLLFILSSMAASGCYHQTVVRETQPVVVSPTGDVVVREAPPPVKHEVITTAPSASHVWIPGYWINRQGRYVWMPGHWELRPRSGAAWVPGHWDSTSRGWIWTPGHWE